MVGSLRDVGVFGNFERVWGVPISRTSDFELLLDCEPRWNFLETGGEGRWREKELWFGGKIELGVIRVDVKTDVFSEDLTKRMYIDDEKKGP